MLFRSLIFTFLFTPALLVPNLLKSQSELTGIPEEDSTVNRYYQNLNNQFILRVFVLQKSNSVDLSKDNQSLKYRPNGTFSLGVGFNYKWLGLGVSLGLPSTVEQNRKYGKTQRFDLQVSLYTKVLGANAHIQNYKGYYLSNPDKFTVWEEDYYPQLPDMNVSTMGANLFYIFNSKKFSYKAAFVGNQVQRRSAGSAVTGIFFTQDEVSTDSGFIPKEIVDTTWHGYDLKSFKASTIGVNAGYLYTFVIGQKGFFVSLAAIPGIGYREYLVTALHGYSETKDLFAVHLLGRFAIGYTRSNLFFNLSAGFNFRNYEYNSYSMSLSTEQLRFTFAWRFETKASKKRDQYYRYGK